MSEQYPGGWLTKSPPTPAGPYETDAAPGLWTLDQAQYYKKLGLWPTQGNIAGDPYFEYVTMLLHGDGVNGGQNNTFLDSSANNFTVSRAGNATQGSFSPYGTLWSNQFNGSSYIQPAASANLNINTNAFTIEAWVFINAGTGYQAIYMFGPGQYDGLYYYNKTLVFYDTSAGAILISGASTIPIGVWTHVAATRDASNNLRIFVNGVTYGPATYTTNLNDNQPRIGANKVATPSEFLNGYISNLRLTKSFALYTSNFTPSTTPLTADAYTSLLTCQSNYLKDNSANNFAITNTGTVSVQRFSPFSPTSAYSTATIGGSGYFDGTGDYLDINANTAFDFGTGDFTIEFWALQTVTGGYPGVASITKTNPGVNNGYFNIELSESRGIFLHGDLGECASSSAVVAGDRSWHHWAITRASGTWRLFKDGVSLTLTTNTIGSNSFIGTDGIVVGSQVGSGSTPAYYPLTGYLSNFRVVKGTALYTSNFTPSTTPLTAVANTQLLLNFTNGAIFDNAMMNDLETVGNAQISTSVKKYGTGSLAFDGTGDWLAGPNTPNTNLDGGDFTLEAWVYLTDATSVSPIVAKGFGSAGGYMMWVQSTLRVRVYDSGGTAYTATSSASVSSNTWTHIAGVRSGNTITVYINGTASGTVSYSGTSTNSAVVEVGGYNSGTVSLNGYIDDLRITKGLARYTANFTPPTGAFPNT